MEGLLKGKIALVTGSSRGIGAAIAESFAKAGAHVIVNYVRSEQKARALADQLMEAYDVEALPIQADVTEEQDVQHMIDQILKEFDTLDVVVNNALFDYTFDPEARKKAWDIDWEDYQRQLDGSLKGSFHVCKYAMPIMKANTTGKIINITTNLLYQPVVPYHDYNTAKGALLSYSHNLAAELGPFGITVNCVAPGLVYPTDASQKTKEEIRDAIIAQTPLRRIAKPEDVTGSVLYLASSLADFVTGQTIVVDGGLNMK